MTNFKERVINECDGLEERIDSLIEFMHGDIYPALTPTDQGLLMVQLSHMKAYAGVLRDRIERFSKPPNTATNEIKTRFHTLDQIA